MKSVFYAAMVAALFMPSASSAQSENAPAQSKPQHYDREADDRPKTTPDRNAPAGQPAPASANRSNNRAARLHPFTSGSRFSRSSAPNYRRVDYRESSRLSAPNSGFVWVRAGNDALLVRLSDNIVTRIVADVF